MRTNGQHSMGTRLAWSILFAIALGCATAWAGQAAFVDVTGKVGLAGVAGSAVAWGDYDNDGWVDLYDGRSLWHNEGGKRFAKVPGLSLGGSGLWGDFDNDGRLDLFVGNFSHRPAYQDRPKFLRSLGPKRQFRFEDKSAKAGLRWQESYASPALGDFDDDGHLDLFFTTVYPGDKSVLYRNNGDWTFTDVTPQAGVATARTYQAAWADYDNDGDLDLMSGGKLFQNPGTPSHWLKVRLEGGGKVNRAAIGAQARLRLGRQTLTRQVEGATGEGNQNDLTLHFGLGRHDGPVQLTVAWPDGSTQELRTPVDRLLLLSAHK